MHPPRGKEGDLLHEGDEDVARNETPQRDQSGFI